MVSHNSEKVHIMIEDESFVTPYYYDPYRLGNNLEKTQTSPGAIVICFQRKHLRNFPKPKIGSMCIRLMRMVHSFLMVAVYLKKKSIFMEVEIKAEKFDETNVNVYEGQSCPLKRIEKLKHF